MTWTKDDYEAITDKFHARAKAWMKAHPGAVPTLAFQLGNLPPFPPEMKQMAKDARVAFIGDIAEMIEHGVAIVNDDAKGVLAAMTVGIERQFWPTAMQFRVILEDINR